MKNIFVLSALVIATVISGCAYVPYARESKKKPREGGIISLKTEHRDEDRIKADSMMASNCGSGWAPRVTEEGEVAVGTRTSGQASRGRDQEASSGFKIGAFSLGGNPGTTDSTNTVSETSTLREWQIVYVCEKIKT
ncbi:MAG: hypothetical protein ACXWQO_07175 [Bdellovibrionota bacterium]